MTRRIAQLTVGLLFYGFAIAMMLRGALGASPWDVLSQGVVLRSGLNFAVVTKVPAIFVFENNHYSEHTGVDYAVGTAKDIASRAEAFGMKVWRANGCDFFDTYAVMGELLDYVRSTNLPAAIELDTERFYGHFEGDPQRYRGPGELDRIRATRDALKIFRDRAPGAGLTDLAPLDAIDAEVAQLIEEATAEARAAAPPDPATVAEDVYVDY